MELLNVFYYQSISISYMDITAWLVIFMGLISIMVKGTEKILNYGITYYVSLRLLTSGLILACFWHLYRICLTDYQPILADVVIHWNLAAFLFWLAFFHKKKKLWGIK